MGLDSNAERLRKFRFLPQIIAAIIPRPHPLQNEYLRMITQQDSHQCPLCGSDDVTLVKCVRSGQLVDEWSRGLSIDISSQLGGHKEIKLYECRESKLRFFKPNNIAGDGAFYDQLSTSNGYYMSWKWEHEIAFQSLQPNESVLEIGCGKGTFVERVKSKLGSHSEGIELNEAAAHQCREKGIPVSVMDIREVASLRAGEFDVVCAFQVLEHIPDPHDFLGAAIQLVRPGGRLLLCVPNNDSFLRHQWNLLDMPPHHMTQWTAESFKSLEHVFPVKLIAAHTEPLASYHVKGFVSTYAKHYGRRSMIHKLAWNGLTRLALRGVLRTGIRRLLCGQSLYAELKRTA